VLDNKFIHISINTNCVVVSQRPYGLLYFKVFVVCANKNSNFEFYILLIVHLGTIFVNNQLDAYFFFTYVYFYSLHVSGSHVPIIRRINCINTTYMKKNCASIWLFTKSNLEVREIWNSG
jgi:hypothetical protein